MDSRIEIPMSEAEWTYICVLARYADQTANRRKNLFESEPYPEVWSDRDELILKKMYDNEYVHRSSDIHDPPVHEPPVHVTSDTRRHIDDIFRNFLTVYNGRRRV